jgi:hypothetical protein
MKLRTTLVTAALFAVAAGAAHAQVRMEPEGSPFVWEALGATPTLRLMKREQAVLPSAATKAVADPTNATPGRPSDFTYGELNATPRIDLPRRTAAAPAVSIEAPATAKSGR